MITCVLESCEIAVFFC